MTEFPYGWAETTVGEIAQIQLGKMLDKEKNKGVPTQYLRNVNVRWGAFDLSDVAQMRVTKAERTHFNIEDGDLLVCEGGEPGRAAVWSGGPNELAFQKALLRVRPLAGISSHWLANLLKWKATAGDLQEYFTGTTIKHLTAVSLRRVPLPLPPSNEQCRIITMIEGLSIHAERARVELNRVTGLPTEVSSAAALLERLDQAILNKAFRGELVPQDPNDEPASVLLERIRASRAAAAGAAPARRRRGAR